MAVATLPEIASHTEARAIVVLITIEILLLVFLFSVPEPIVFAGAVLTGVAFAAILTFPLSSIIAVVFITFGVHSLIIGEDFVVPVLGMNWYAMDWIILFSLISFALSRMFIAGQKIPKTQLTRPLVVFLLFLPLSAAIGIQYGTRSQDALADARLFFYYVGFFLPLAFIRNKRDLEIVFWAMIVFGIVGSIPEIIESLSGSFYDSLIGRTMLFRRITGAHEVNYAVLITASISMLLFVRSFVKKVLLGFSIIVTSIALFLSYTRGSWLAALAALVALGFLLIRYTHVIRKNILTMFSIAILVLSAIVILDLVGVFNIETLTQRSNLISTKQVDLSSLSRITEWQLAWRLFVDHPLFGVGLGYIYKFYAVGFGIREQTFLHNSYLYVLSKMGILGFLLFLWLFGKSLVVFVKTFRVVPEGEEMGLLLAFGSMLVVYAVKSLTTWHLNTLTSSLFVGIIVGVIAVYGHWYGNTSSDSSTREKVK